jgi:hypothetical protein
MIRSKIVCRTAALVIFAAAALCVGVSRGADNGKSSGEELFNGKDFTGWKMSNPRQAEVWKVVSSVKLDPNDPNNLAAEGTGAEGRGIMLRVKHEEGYGANPYTEKNFGDCEVHVEFTVPGHSNSGVYLMGQYEVQILSDHGRPNTNIGTHNTGAIYATKPPSSLELKPHGEWNTMDIVFQAPRFENGKKVKNAVFVSVVLNGKKIQENVDTPKPTGGQLPGGEKPTGPILLQGDHGCVAFRSVRVKALDQK